MDRFIEETNAIISYNQTTDNPDFVRFQANQSLKLTGNTLMERSNTLLKDHQEVFGIKNPDKELLFESEKTDDIDFKHLKRIQEYHGIPVFDGQLNFHFNSAAELVAINGNFIRDIKVDPNPVLSAQETESIALNEVYLQNKEAYTKPLFVNESKLFVFNDGLAKNQIGQNHLAYKIEVRNDLDIREYLFIDAHNGEVIEQYTGICNALYRRLYENNTGNQIWEEGDPLPGGLDQWQQNEVIAAGHSYYFFSNAFGRDSYDDEGAEMLTINNNPNINCPNATWNGTTANYCDGTATDDVVAHEWGHAYTEYTSNLIYAWQPGALNESFSDIWGETIDVLNGYEDGDEDLSLRTGCSSSDRWRMGEDATAFGGAIRDMWDPTCDGDPGKVSDSEYHCSTSDNGGVHSNSGVPNHCYALLVDGGTYNGHTITGIGFTKAAHIFWRVQSYYLTQTSGFDVFANALRSACSDLVGINLEGLSTSSTPAGLSGEILTVADCDNLEEVILAVELDSDPTQCGFDPLLESAPLLCTGASPTNAFFFEDWESGIGSWTMTQVPENPGSWDPRDWVLDSSLPENRSGQGMFGIDPLFGDCNADLDNGIIRLESPSISIPSAASAPILMAFDHYVSIENNWDGGNIKYSLNGGAWTLLPSVAFTANAYNNTLTNSGNDNPLAGETAFSGADENSYSGTWGQSQIDLSEIGVVPGDDIQFRWELGTDGCNGWDGWYLDEIRVYSCILLAPNANLETSSSLISLEGTACNSRAIDFDVTLSQAPSANTTVTWSFSGTATNPEDYFVTGGTSHEFTPTNWNIPASVTVDIFQDGVFESNEEIVVTITSAIGGDAVIGANDQLTFTLIDDDNSPTSVQTSILLEEDFETGFGLFTTTSTGDLFVVDDNNALTSTYWTTDGNTSNFAFVNDDECNCDMSDAQLISPVLDLSGNLASAELSFDHAFSDITSEIGEVLVSIDNGTTYTSIQALANTSTGGSLKVTPWMSGVTLDLTPYLGNNQVVIAWKYDDDGTWGYGMSVDNVIVTTTAPRQVQTSVNFGMGNGQAEVDLGPNQTIHFFDENTGNIMVSITEQSGHDYGCTTVYIENAGISTSESAAGTALWLLDKTLRVEPMTNNSSGQYEIILYYTADEMTGWEDDNGEDYTQLDLKLFKSNGNIGSASGEVEETSVNVASFNSTEWQLTGTFNTGFSGIGAGGGSGVILPIELLYFNALSQEETVLLKWRTEFEINNDKFIVQRSKDGINWENLLEIPGKGNSIRVSDYEVKDNHPLMGVSYYRLKQIDFDGQQKYSNIRQVNRLKDSELLLYPNPVDKILKVSFENINNELGMIKIYDMHGKIVWISENSIDSVTNSLEISMEQMASGTYILNLITESQTFQSRFVVY